MGGDGCVDVDVSRAGVGTQWSFEGKSKEAGSNRPDWEGGCRVRDQTPGRD